MHCIFYRYSSWTVTDMPVTFMEQQYSEESHLMWYRLHVCKVITAFKNYKLTQLGLHTSDMSLLHASCRSRWLCYKNKTPNSITAIHYIIIFPTYSYPGFNTCIQNSFARAVVKAPKSSHITPTLKSLHWLKVNEHIEYKILSLSLFVLQCLTLLVGSSDL